MLLLVIEKCIATVIAPATGDFPLPVFNYRMTGQVNPDRNFQAGWRGAVYGNVFS